MRPSFLFLSGQAPGGAGPSCPAGERQGALGQVGQARHRANAGRMALETPAEPPSGCVLFVDSAPIIYFLEVIQPSRIGFSLFRPCSGGRPEPRRFDHHPGRGGLGTFGCGQRVPGRAIPARHDEGPGSGRCRRDRDDRRDCGPFSCAIPAALARCDPVGQGGGSRRLRLGDARPRLSPSRRSADIGPGSLPEIICRLCSAALQYRAPGLRASTPLPSSHHPADGFKGQPGMARADGA